MQSHGCWTDMLSPPAQKVASLTTSRFGRCPQQPVCISWTTVELDWQVGSGNFCRSSASQAPPPYREGVTPGSDHQQVGILEHLEVPTQRARAELESSWGLLHQPPPRSGGSLGAGPPSCLS